MKTFVDISGFGNSGKTAVTDYLRQFDTVFSFGNHVEFEIFRVPGGILDLYFSIYESWNMIRSTMRINEFKKLIDRIGTVQSSSNPISYFTASGHGYDQFFNGKFREISHQFVDKIITAEIRLFWPYENLRLPPSTVFYNKLKARFFNSLTSANVYFSNSGEFCSHVAAYMQTLFAEAVTNDKSHILLNNTTEPYNPTLCLKLMGNAYSIIVDRDPRDIYASQIRTADKFVPDFEKVKNAEKVKREMLSFDDIDQFIFRYKTIKKNVRNDNEDRVLRLRYEDFLLDHEAQADIVKKFVKLPENAAIINKDKFNLSNSVKNVGLWKKYADTKEIMQIERELGEYCYQSK